MTSINNAIPTTTTTTTTAAQPSSSMATGVVIPPLVTRVHDRNFWLNSAFRLYPAVLHKDLGEPLGACNMVIETHPFRNMLWWAGSSGTAVFTFSEPDTPTQQLVPLSGVSPLPPLPPTTTTSPKLFCMLSWEFDFETSSIAMTSGAGVEMEGLWRPLPEEFPDPPFPGLIPGRQHPMAGKSQRIFLLHVPSKLAAFLRGSKDPIFGSLHPPTTAMTTTTTTSSTAMELVSPSSLMPARPRKMATMPYQPRQPNPLLVAAASVTQQPPIPIPQQQTTTTTMFPLPLSQQPANQPKRTQQQQQPQQQKQRRSKLTTTTVQQQQQQQQQQQTLQLPPFLAQQQQQPPTAVAHSLPEEGFVLVNSPVHKPTTLGTAPLGPLLHHSPQIEETTITTHPPGPAPPQQIWLPVKRGPDTPQEYLKWYCASCGFWVYDTDPRLFGQTGQIYHARCATNFVPSTMAAGGGAAAVSITAMKPNQQQANSSTTTMSLMSNPTPPPRTLLVHSKSPFHGLKSPELDEQVAKLLTEAHNKAAVLGHPGAAAVAEGPEPEERLADSEEDEDLYVDDGAAAAGTVGDEDDEIDEDSEGLDEYTPKTSSTSVIGGVSGRKKRSTSPTDGTPRKLKRPTFRVQKPKDENEPTTVAQCMWQGCGRIFDRVSDLTLHMQTHTSTQSVHKCLWEGCSRTGKPFANHSGLFRHLRYHTGDKPCKCTFGSCGFCSVDNGELRRHLKLVHHVENFDGLDDGPSTPTKKGLET